MCLANNRLHGKGECRYADGSVFRGRWYQGKRKGAGFMFDAKGRPVKAGMWLGDEIGRASCMERV